MIIQDFNKCERNGRRYGGMSGSKLGIIYNNENWILKFPKSTMGIRRVEIPYTTAYLSEYIGSQIYQILGIETHETLLGVYDNKIVVACKDFLKEDERLDEFIKIRNEYIGNEQNHVSSDNFTDLQEIIKVMELNPLFKELPELKNRFWDMFVIDALIGNNDRNDGNWGIIVNNNTRQVRIAPVFDNGNSFNNKSSDEQISRILNDFNTFIASTYDQRKCIFTINGIAINPLKYIESRKNTELNEAVKRIIPTINLDRIEILIKNIPNEFNNLKIMSEIQKDFYFKTIEYRTKQILIPIYKLLNKENIREQHNNGR